MYMHTYVNMQRLKLFAIMIIFILKTIFFMFHRKYVIAFAGQVRPPDKASFPQAITDILILYLLL